MSQTTAINYTVDFFKRSWYKIPAFLYHLKNPPQKYREIEWGLNKQESASSSSLGHLPNIVLIVADDLGINDISGGAGVATPNIDSLFEHGARFPNAYSGHATCAPSRAAIFTGRTPTKMGFEFTPTPMVMTRIIGAIDSSPELPSKLDQSKIKDVPAMADMALPHNFSTIAERLHNRAYSNYLIGKWHLGHSKGYSPLERGFDETLTFPLQQAAYGLESDPDLITAQLKGSTELLDEFLRHCLPFTVSYNNGPIFEPNEYMTDYLTHQAVKLIDAKKDSQSPFFLSLMYTAPHSPIQAKRSDYEDPEIARISSHPARVYAAMIKALDRGVGEVIDALKAAGKYENTLVIFTSDNGAAHYVGLPKSNYPYRGWKATLFEGGIRVPFAMQWPKVISPGTIYSKPVSHVDIYATIMSAATGQYNREKDLDPFCKENNDLPLPETLFRETSASNGHEDSEEGEPDDDARDADIDGSNLLEKFVLHVPCDHHSARKETGANRTLSTLSAHYKHHLADIAPHEHLFWRSGHYKALRYGDWKLQVADEAQKQWLFNLANDPTEQVNLVEQAQQQEGSELASMLQRLRSKLEEVDATQFPPLWPSVLQMAVPVDKTALDTISDTDEYVYWPN
eukprot:gene2285-2501_t